MELSTYTSGNHVYDQAYINERRANKGCFTPLKKMEHVRALKLIHENIIFKRCVCWFYTPEVHWLMNEAMYYKNNFTCSPTYIYKYKRISNKFKQALDIINNYILEQERKAMAEQAKKAKVKG